MEVKQVFADFVQDLYKRNQKSLAAYMSDPIFSYTEGKISLTVGSKTLKNELEEEVKGLSRMFRKRGLHFPGLDLKIDALKVKEYKPFTPKEQFNAAAKDHPILKDFADRFGLDFDV
ncbi:hypothetical protein GYB22_06310 [bacterium]|nr:hypothetical protein [bacterium]